MAPILTPSLPNNYPKKTFTPRKQVISNKITHDDNLAIEARLSTVSTVDDSSIPSLELESESHRIWLSNVVVKRPKKLLARSKWHYIGLRRLIVMIIVHGLAMFGPWTFNWAALRVAIILNLVTGLLGITLSFHRNLTHKSFTLPKCLEYLFAYFGSLALQGDPIGWVRTHRYHHKYVDSERDPHSPIQGFWYSHISWIFDTAALTQKRGESSIAKELEAQKFYKFMRSTYLLHHFALLLLLYAFGGFSYVVWGMGVRTMWGFHATFCVNSVCHVWGNQAWDTGDLSKNNWWVALLTGGEGWHNNHHAFEYSARQGLEWWQVDVTWYIIKLLETIGFAKDVKLPTKAHKQRLAFKSEGTLD